MLKAPNVTWSTDATQVALYSTLKPAITGDRESRSVQKQNRFKPVQTFRGYFMESFL